MTDTSTSIQSVQPKGLIDKCIGHSIWILMKRDIEFVGTLKAFDTFVNLHLENVTQTEPLPDGTLRISTIPELLLNGSNICMLIPGSTGPVSDSSSTSKSEQ